MNAWGKILDPNGKSGVSLIQSIGAERRTDLAGNKLRLVRR
jgi:hypothetical protein